jgi:hypothetical protein
MDCRPIALHIHFDIFDSSHSLEPLGQGFGARDAAGAFEIDRHAPELRAGGYSSSEQQNRYTHIRH